MVDDDLIKACENYDENSIYNLINNCTYGNQSFACAIEGKEYEYEMDLLFGGVCDSRLPLRPQRYD